MYQDHQDRTGPNIHRITTVRRLSCVDVMVAAAAALLDALVVVLLTAVILIGNV
jgi:hypothetical protein